MHSCDVWKAEGNGSQASATSVFSVGKCHHEVSSSLGSIPVSCDQLCSVKVRASFFGQWRSSRHRIVAELAVT